jgi:N-formylglutamate amidohydrolase
MRKQGASSDHWIDEFYHWLEARGFTRPTARYHRLCLISYSPSDRSV